MRTGFLLACGNGDDDPEIKSSFVTGAFSGLGGEAMPDLEWLVLSNLPRRVTISEMSARPRLPMRRE